MRSKKKTVAVLLLTIQFAGCSILTENGVTPDSVMRLTGDKRSANKQSEDATGDIKIANPPAKTLRFDGHEIVLGESENIAILEVDKLAAMLEPLVFEQRFQTASLLIERHRESAERLLIERWASGADDAIVQLVAEVLSRRCSKAETSWKSLIAVGRSQKQLAIQYQNLRNSFAEEMRTNEPTNEAAEKLMQASVKINQPLVRIDALRLLGLRELVSGRHAWAESQFRQAIELANASGNTLLAADLWLTVAETARRSNQMSTANTAWTTAVNLQLTSSNRNGPLDVSFWMQADRTRPEAIQWPKEIGQNFASLVKKIGCSSECGTEAILWAAIADSQIQRGELQSALVNFKKSETMVRGNDAMWLRIAQAKCLAGMGQAPSASAILSGPAASAEPSVSAAAMAAMGSIKLNAGAYQQGAQLLHKAIGQAQALDWPGRNQAMADFAIAQLILGDTDAGLTALHEAQQLFEKAGERSLLIQSLENEQRLLEHEHRSSQFAQIQSRISQLERL